MSGRTILIELQYFPPIDAFSKFMESGEVTFEAFENYQKASFRNRCWILGPNGRNTLSIPLIKGKNSQLPIKEVRISNAMAWQKQHWASIQTAYGSAPFYEEYVDLLVPLFKERWDYLYDFNLSVFSILNDAFFPDIKIGQTEIYQKNPQTEEDCRMKFTPRKREWLTKEVTPYPQVFEYKYGFQPHLSILDLLFCMGPGARTYL